jgi:hypothetical protein
MKAPRTALACAALLCALSFQPASAQPAGNSSEGWPWTEVARSAQSNPKEFGPLRLDMGEAEVTEKLGPPDITSRRGMMMDSDEYTYSSDYSALGVTVFYTAFDESSPGTVMAIRAKAPCDWTAYGGLKIGMNIDAASKILERGRGGNVSAIGSVGTEYAGLYFELLETTVAARLEMGMLSVIYVGPNLP